MSRVKRTHELVDEESKVFKGALSSLKAENTKLKKRMAAYEERLTRLEDLLLDLPSNKPLRVGHIGVIGEAPFDEELED